MDQIQEILTPAPDLHVLSPERPNPILGQVGPGGTGEIAINPTAGLLCAHFLLSPHGTGAGVMGDTGGEGEQQVDTDLEKDFNPGLT